jgi:hypothetical protein
MKIGELFIALGFKVEGKDKVDEVERGIKKTAVEATKLTIAVNAVNLALIALMTTAGRAGQALKNFARTTGLNPEELQRWQHLGEVTGVAADEVKSAFENLQKTRANFALGEPSDVGVWQLLGVDPTQDPSAVLSQLRETVKKLDPAIAHELLSRLGLGGLTPMLRATDAEFRKWSRNFVITRDQIERLAKFNAAWASLKMSVGQVKNLFAAALAPALEILARLLEWVASKIAAFVDWLNKGSIVATVVRWGIVAVTIALLALGAALAVVTVALGVLTAAMIAFDIAAWASGIPEIILAITGAVAAIVAIVSGLLLLIDDIITSITGGQAVTRRLGEWLASFKAIEAVIRGIWWVWDRLVFAFRWGMDYVKKNAREIGVNLAGSLVMGAGPFAALKLLVTHWDGIKNAATRAGRAIKDFFSFTTVLRVSLVLLRAWRSTVEFVRDAWQSFVRSIAATIDAILHPFRTLLSIWDAIVEKAKLVRAMLRLFPMFMPGATPAITPERVTERAVEPAEKQARSVTINQENHLHAAIDGSRSPGETGKAVTKSFKEEIAGAAYQLPVPNY